MRLHFFFFLFFSTVIHQWPVAGQILKGKITNVSGEVVPYATVYVQEIRQGTISNIRGDYEIRLPEGNYVVICQSLGYEPVILEIAMKANAVVVRDVRMPEQLYEIPEISISASGEDPAYAIMRKAIGLAPYHINQVNYYKADVYLKGNLFIKKIPGILKKRLSAEHSDNAVTVSAGGRRDNASADIREGGTYLMESVNEIEFNAPDRYVQRVISFHSTFPDNDSEISPMDFIQASFYQPLIADIAISPLSPQAFSHYRFKYAGASPQGDYIINKIEVIPRRKSQQLFQGIIYIIEDLWCLHSLDLTNENLAGKVRIRGVYIPVKENIWLPVSYTIDFNFSMLGIKADAGYGSSVKYLEVTHNEQLQRPEDYSSVSRTHYHTQDTTQTANRQKIEEILQKDELTNRDMVRLANLMKKESAGALPDSARNNLEIKDNTVYIIEEDAGKKDSLYWSEIRPIPLSETEIRSFRIRDSTLHYSIVSRDTTTDSIQPVRSPKAGPAKRFIRVATGGHTWRTPGLSFTWGGMVKPEAFSFNTVDGFVYGTDFRMTGTFGNKNTLSIYPDIKYAFSRKKILWRVNANFNPEGLRERQLFIRTGAISRDMNSGTSVNPFINTMTSLLMKNNYMKLYESSYFTAGYRSEIVNGLTAEFSTGCEKRKILDNTTDFSLAGSSRNYTSNQPANRYLDPETPYFSTLSDHSHYNFVTTFSYTPFQKYSIVNNRKINRGSEWPTFRLTWKHGLNGYPDDLGGYIHYDMFRFEVYGKREAGAFSELNWKAGAGGFADNRKISWFDFFHFNSQPFPIILDDFYDAFMLADFYSLSSPEFYGEFHIRYTSPYLVLKYLPGLSNTLIRENIRLSYLGSRYNSTYTEIGYTLSEVFLILETGVFAAFDNLRYKAFGAKIILRIN